ncbi:MAG: DUF3526 domain-containing protein [Pseudomonadota bacterium]
MTELSREWRFALREKTLRNAVIAAFVLATLAVASGLVSAGQQRSELGELVERVTADRKLALSGQSDPGGSAYYSFHLTFSPPPPLAFAAEGVRSVLPWKHRIRMLALEGQIYESDPGNLELSAFGALDYAFVVATLLPLLLLIMLHDLWASERRAGRLELLLATSPSGDGVLFRRAAVRGAMICAAVLLPFVLGAAWSGAAMASTGLIALVVLGHALVWMLISTLVARRVKAGPTVLATLLGVWLVSIVAVPAVGKLVAERSVEVPAGGELLLLQRETVNDAWDLSKSETMDAFVAANPQWAPYVQVSRPFEWKWYYAFQWLGDARSAAMSAQLRDGVAKRDSVMGIVALFSPTLLTERLVTRVAGTDIHSYLAYEQCVRDFHASLQSFFYPLLFEAEAFSDSAMAGLPNYEPCTE